MLHHYKKISGPSFNQLRSFMTNEKRPLCEVCGRTLRRLYVKRHSRYIVVSFFCLFCNDVRVGDGSVSIKKSPQKIEMPIRHTTYPVETPTRHIFPIMGETREDQDMIEDVRETFRKRNLERLSNKKQITG